MAHHVRGNWGRKQASDQQRNHVVEANSGNADPEYEACARSNSDDEFTGADGADDPVWFEPSIGKEGGCGNRPPAASARCVNKSPDQPKWDQEAKPWSPFAQRAQATPEISQNNIDAQ